MAISPPQSMPGPNGLTIDVVDKKRHDAQMSAMSELKKENARKDREIARKDKALADAATMLMLSKKAEAIWGAKES